MCLASQMGCFTTITALQYRTPKDMPSPILFDDSIFAVGEISPSIKQKIGCKNASMFLGKKNSYLIFDGSERLIQIIKSINGQHLSIDQDDEKMYTKDKKIWGSIRLTYNNPQISPDEESQLMSLGFQKPKSHNRLYQYETSIKITGSIQEAINVKQPDSGFVKPRNFTFRKPAQSAIVPNIKITALMPVAIAVDSATWPLQLLFVTIIDFTQKRR